MIWLKSVGIVLIVAGCGAWGLFAARSLERRADQLRELRVSLGFLEKEITFMFTPLSRALEKTALFCQGPVASLFSESSRVLQLRQGVTVDEAWSAGLNYLQTCSDLAKADILLLQSAAGQLGMSDAAEQKKLFQLLQEQLHFQEERARADIDSGKRVRAYGGFIMGAVVVLLLL